MKLYEYKNSINVVPATSAEQARNRYYEETEIDSGFDSDFEILIPHEDFVKLFRLARTLNNIDQYDNEDIEVLVDAYAKKLGYSLSKSDLWNGILKWAERFMDAEDEDIEDWLN